MHNKSSKGTAYFVHVLRWSLRSHFCAKRAQSKPPLCAALNVNMGQIMKYLFIILLLSTSLSQAKEWKTDLFTIDLPESLIVETDKKRRLLAFSESGPNSPPFLSIEFGKGVPIDVVLEEVNSSIAALGGGELKQEECLTNCKAYYFEWKMDVEGEGAFLYYYLGQTSTLSFIISYTGTNSIEAGREFVKNVARQIREQNI
ncbi:hypothetical protein OQJ46_16495 [Microbulbifer thermotolerans]|uniref:hypothetical protein n=1 Tax=Microbulbifer thermotolerans TaxID=252514 RepID=UPI002249535D|nr:hypothetical protein [Microbulbifer thermotolerans]MCX2784592.1 hypothetical protein [Microbulbifer thermotolerans]MCX2793899.1 hypothetical protein [Microbulbifer thermotolerans]